MASKVNPNFDQTNFRGRDDTAGLNTDSGWAADLNNDWTQNVDETFRIRFEIDETATTTETEAPSGQLEASYNGGSYFDVSAFSTYVYAVVTTQWSNEAATTNLISGSSRSFVTGRGSHDGLVNNSPNLSNEHTEFEYSLKIRGTDVNDEDYINVRVKNLDNYSNTPTITVNVASSPQTAPVSAADASGDAKSAARLPGGVARTVVEGSAGGDGPAVTTLSEATRSVGAGDAAGDAPTASAQPGNATRAVSAADGAADAPAVTVLADQTAVVTAADAAGDSPAATAAPGNVNRSVVAGSAAADSPAVSVYSSQSAIVAAATSDGDAPTITVAPGTAPRLVVEGSASGDAPTVTVQPGGVSRLVTEGSADADAPAVTTLGGGGGSPQSRTVVEASAAGDAPAVTILSEISLSVAAASADGDAPTAAPAHTLIVSAASAWTQLPLHTAEHYLYQHFNVRGQKRGYTDVPKSTETTIGAYAEEGTDPDVPIEWENIRTGRLPRRK